MKLYLVQHGEAVQEEADPSRPLTSRGSQEVRKVAAFLKSIFAGPISTFHSGKLRALQTAGIIVGSLGPGYQVQQAENLSPGDSVQPWVEKINEETIDLMIVGHLPFLGKLTSSLLTGSESKTPVAFRQGGVVCLQRKEGQAWQVDWVVPPDILP